MGAKSPGSILTNEQSSWKDRIPFILFFGITTSVELFQSKLSSRAVRCLKGQCFAIEHLDVETILMDLQKAQLQNISLRRQKETSKGVTTAPWLGSSLTKRIMAKQLNHVQSHSAFTRALKVGRYDHDGRYMF